MKAKQALTDDLLNTAEAALLLGVSEASVRRWGDAGLYPMERVGQRRQRRFRRADLVSFLSSGRHTGRQAGPVMVPLGTSFVPRGTHVATVFASDAGRMRIAIPFLRDGLTSGQPCVLIAAGEILDSYLEALEKDVKTELAEARGRGLFVTTPTVGRTVDAALASWESRAAEFTSSGSTVVRAVGDMACVQTSLPLKEMLTYESLLSVLIKRLPCVNVCQYDVREFDGPTVLEAIKAHPDAFEVGLENLIS